MKIPLSLIKSFIHLDLAPAKIAETLTLLGLEVDGIANEHPSFAGVVVGEILSTAPQSNTSKLVIAQVSDGRDVFQVICGAPNCRPGMKTAFAKPGALLKEVDGKEQRIEKTTIRGTESFGMLCSEKELGISSRHDGIIDLPLEMETGRDLVQFLWDPVFEISLTPNLGHCMSALGVARELSAALQKPLHHHKPIFHSQGKPKLDRFKISEIDPKVCARYTCRLIEGISIGPSPFWLQKELLACGLTPISNAVDIANFVLLKMGQPLHVFDADKLQGSSLSIKTLSTPHSFLGLDGVEREVPADAIFILNGHQPVALAGILGGENSAVTESTTSLLIESAVFDPIVVRKTAKKMGLRTESSQRFEKGIDPSGTLDALDEASALILKLCGGSLAGTIDITPNPLSPKKIFCRPNRVNELLGTSLSLTEIQEIFHRLKLHAIETDKGMLQVEIPLFRSDLSEEIDLVEEVARIYGYNHIKKSVPRCSISQIAHDASYLFEKETRERLIGFGLQEFLNSDLISKRLAKLALEWVRPGAVLLTAVHAKTEEYSVLRPSLLPGLLQSAQNNFNHKNHDLAAFEIGRIHFLQNDQLIEEPMAAILLSGKNHPAHWSQKGGNFDFFDLKGYVENLFEALHIPPAEFRAGSHLSFHPNRQADVFCGSLQVGSFGEIHPSLLDVSDIKQRILYAELNLHLLMQQPRSAMRMKPISSFPSSERDWTVSLPIRTSIEDIFKAVRSFHALLLEKVELIDLYTPETGDVKNATLRFTYRDPIKTISFEEVESAHAKLIDSIQSNLS